MPSRNLRINRARFSNSFSGDGGAGATPEGEAEEVEEAALTGGTTSDPDSISLNACCTNGTNSLGKLAAVRVQAYSWFQRKETNKQANKGQQCSCFDMRG